MKFDPKILLSDNYITIDFETTNIDKGHARNRENKLLVCVVRGPQTQSKAWILSEYSLYKKLKPYIDNCDFIVAHNAKFELQWLTRSGFKLHELPPVWCTQVAEYNIYGNLKKKLSLEECCKRRGLPSKENYVSSLIKSGVCPSEIPQNALITYCNKDVIITEQLMLAQREEIIKLSLLPVVYTEFLYIPVLADLELIGLSLNKEKVEVVGGEIHTELIHIDEELEEMTGGINMASPKQVAEFLYDTLKFRELTKYGKPIRTEGGQRKTDAITLELLVAKTKRQERFKELKLKQAKLSKKYNTYIIPYLEACAKSKGIIYGKYNQTVARNHRLTSSEPNLQNQPREFKELFCARFTDYKYVKADYKQLEFRTAAYLGKDRQAYEDIRDSVDVHEVTASIIGCDRQTAKSHTFKPLYGGKSGTPSEQRYYEHFRKTYSGITETQEKWKLELLRQNGLECLILANGMRFYWEGTRVTSTGYIINSTTICNYPVSYFATSPSGISGIGTMLLWRFLKENGMKSFMVSVTHDDVGLEVHKDELEEIRYILTNKMVHGTITYLKEIYGIDFNIPLEVECIIYE